MQKTIILLVVLSWFFQTEAQQEIKVIPELKQATLFFSGAQLRHEAKSSLKPGKQTLVIEKLTDYLDVNSIQVKAEGAVTILSVGMRKNFEDERISNAELRELNVLLHNLEKKEKALRDEQAILQVDRSILNQNSALKGNESGVKVAELKEAYTFIHARMAEISKREAEILEQVEQIVKERNKISQEIDVQRSKPVINYTEILLELDVLQATPVKVDVSYMTPNAGWSPYYDLRSKSVGSTMQLEAKALVHQNTGIDWKEVDLVLSTNDPYQNAQERELLPWYLNYNTPPNIVRNLPARSNPTYDYTGQKIRGEVIDAATGESMPFAKVYFSNNPALSSMTDASGKFELTVPKGASQLKVNFQGYREFNTYINAPYFKVFMVPNAVNFEAYRWTMPQKPGEQLNTSMGISTQNYVNASSPNYSYSGIQNNVAMDQVSVKVSSKKQRSKSKIAATPDQDLAQAYAVSVAQVSKDLRIEYAIQSKFTIPSSGLDQRVSIANYDLPASYEYHAAPKIDPSAYLVAKVSGWEKLNLLNGESSIYFDGTYIGKTYIEAQTTKDTLIFSLGKDSKVQLERSRIIEKSSNKSIGSRQKYEVTWEIKIRNNGAAEIPIMIKDQFPVSINDDIKVKRGEHENAELNDKSGILTWRMQVPKGQSKTFGFNYTVDYRKGLLIYLE